MHLGSSGVLTPLKMFVKICEHICMKVIHIVFSTWEQGFETPPAKCPPVECGQSDGVTDALYRKDRISQSALDAGHAVTGCWGPVSGQWRSEGRPRSLD